MDKETKRLAAIIETQSALAQAGLDLSAFMELAVQKISQLTPSSGSVVELIEGDEMVYRAASGRLACHVGLRLRISGSLSGACTESKQVLLCEDAESDERVDREACRRLGIRSMVVAPLVSYGKSVGVIKLSSERAHAFAEKDVQTLKMMGGLLGSAIGRQAHFEANQRLLAERMNAITALQSEIAHRREFEACLQKSEQRTRLIIDTAHDGFICMDANGIILDWNRQAERIYGWAKEEALGKELAALIIPEERRAGHRAGVKEFARTGSSALINQRLELMTVHRDGRPVPVELSLSSMSDGDSYVANAFVRDISQRKEVEQQLIRLARYDSLTGLANRRHFEEKLKEAMARSTRSGAGLTLMFLDIDHFKSINDMYGHAGGDEALVEFAARINKTIRVTDTAARLAGDEFIVIFEGLKQPDEVHVIGQKILGLLKEAFVIGGEPVRITASIGFAFYRQNCNASELLAKADKALYQAKEKGRHQYAIANP